MTGNLKALTPDEARELGRKGGIASGLARRERKQLREAAETLLGMPLKKGDLEAFDSFKEAGNANVTVAESIVIEQAKRALNGDTKAARFLVDVSGEMPAQKVDLSVSPDTSQASEQIQEMIARAKAQKEEKRIIAAELAAKYNDDRIMELYERS